MKIEKIPRIGIAVKDLEAAKHIFINILGAESGITHQKDETSSITIVEDEIPSEGLKSYFLTLGELQIELMSPSDENGKIAQYIQSRGEGLMTISFKVDDLNESIEYFESKGIRIIGKMLDHHTELDGERHHTPYCFTHPSDFFGILAELAVR